MTTNDTTQDNLTDEPKPARRGRPRKTAVIQEDPLAFLNDEPVVETPEPPVRKTRRKAAAQPVETPEAPVDVPVVAPVSVSQEPSLTLSGPPASVPVSEPEVTPSSTEEVLPQSRLTRRRNRIKRHLTQH